MSRVDWHTLPSRSSAIARPILDHRSGHLEPASRSAALEGAFIDPASPVPANGSVSASDEIRRPGPSLSVSVPQSRLTVRRDAGLALTAIFRASLRACVFALGSAKVHMLTAQTFWSHGCRLGRQLSIGQMCGLLLFQHCGSLSSHQFVNESRALSGPLSCKMSNINWPYARL